MTSYILTLRASIDYSLAATYRQNAYDGRATFVGHISLVKGVPFYGYHVGYKYFLKVYMLNPKHMTRFADLLYRGIIMNRVFQPYESHLQYLLQWMCDYNLYGCAYIDCSTVQFRSPVPDSNTIDTKVHDWHTASIPSEFVTTSAEYPRQSHCTLEVDVCVQDILNRLELQPRPIHHDFQERFINSSPGDKYVPSMAGLWRDETRRRKLRMGLTDPSSSPFPPEVLVSMSSDIREIKKGGWIHEERYRQLVDELVREERARQPGVTFETFTKHVEGDERVKTTVESVEDLYPWNLRDSILEEENVPVVASAISVTDLNNGEETGPSDHTSINEAGLDGVDGLEYEHEDVVSDIEDQPSLDPWSAAEALLQAENDGGATTDAKDEDHGSESGHASTPGKHEIELPEEERPTKRQRLPDALVEMRRVSLEYQSTNDYLEPIRSMPSTRADDGLLRSSQASRASTGIVSVERTPQITANDGLPLVSQSSQTSTLTLRNQPSYRFDKGTEPKENTSQSKADDGLPRPSQSSQTSTNKALRDRPLNQMFPVVKNAHAPGTILRLSQSSHSKIQGGLRAPGAESASTLSTEKPSVKTKKNGNLTLRKKPLQRLWKKAPTIPFSHTQPTPKVASNSKPTSHSEAVASVTRPKNTSRSVSRECYYGLLPPSADLVNGTMEDIGLPPVVYQDAHYSDEQDVPDRAREYAGREFKLQSTSLPYLPVFDPTGRSPANFGEHPPIVVDKKKQSVVDRRRARKCRLRNWELATAPPTFDEVREWLGVGIRPKLEPVPEDKTKSDVKTDAQTLPKQLPQIEGPTQKNKHGFKFTAKQQSTSVKHEIQYMSILSVEVHINSRGSLVPDPALDEIKAIFWCIQGEEGENDDKQLIPGEEEEEKEGKPRAGIICLSDEEDGIAHHIASQVSVKVEHEDNELDILNRMVDIVRQFDPDILTGYNVHTGSWGYLIERAGLQYEYDLCNEMSRMKSQSHGKFGKEADRWGYTNTSTISVTGRHVINIWRSMQKELNLLQYTMENVVFHLLHKRIPHYSHSDLTAWYTSSNPRDLKKVLDYFISRVQLNLDILEANELVPRTSEQARLLGVDFFSVISRGSQYKVESTMFRIAKPENFILISPSRKQVGQQNALECLPLVMEPQSNFYTSPVVVLDFQSLYPSVMIAYNYCYSTLLGRVVPWRGQNKMGFMDFKRDPQLLVLLKDYINIAPNGMIYVKPSVRKSLLAKMLGEILETRVMVKSGMKTDKDDKTLQQLLNNRQLALKLLANVTYGYTSASFSGRMPCSEIADSIVQTGRETLEKAIAIIHANQKWDAEVVYGDTDSLFIHLKGRTRDQAFTIGAEIAEAITNANPKPMRLKFEKVYHPCVLLAKKRYVGFKYESPSQKEPEFDAKGIETVRRDGTPAVQKIEEKALKILFRTADLSLVKRYFEEQCDKIMMGRISIQDFMFAKEVKLGSYSEKGQPPPGALIATKRMLVDPRVEPQYGERVPYVVIAGKADSRLMDRCVAPETLLQDESLEIDAEYYITKNLIPPLERIFNLVGANVKQWYDEMPKVQRARNISILKKTLEGFMNTSTCIVCKDRLDPIDSGVGDENEEAPDFPLCAACLRRPARTLLSIKRYVRDVEHSVKEIESVCRVCEDFAWGEDVKCDSRDCPVYYTRVREKAKLKGLDEAVEDVVQDLVDLGDLEW